MWSEIVKAHMPLAIVLNRYDFNKFLHYSSTCGMIASGPPVLPQPLYSGDASSPIYAGSWRDVVNLDKLARRYVETSQFVIRLQLLLEESIAHGTAPGAPFVANKTQRNYTDIYIWSGSVEDPGPRFQFTSHRRRRQLSWITSAENEAHFLFCALKA